MLHAGNASIRSFRVIPDLPEPLTPLLELAHDLWWTWHPEAVELFTRLDRELWEATGHNPVKMLGMVDQHLLDRVANDQSYLHALSLVHARFKHHHERKSWFQRTHAGLTAGDEPMRVAYFSAEFGLTECFQIYSGGLGILAGDHLKSASELGVPLCGVGLLYRCGYFHQYLNADGWQQETYPDLDFPNQPIRRLMNDDGEQIKVHVELPGRRVYLGLWRCDVGRVPLYLLDANLPENSRTDRDITKTLYGGDIETRIQQEIVLGIGGIRALAAVGEKPTVHHINEGHAAFLALERIAQLREESGVDFATALQAAAAGHIFTTHTPVPAGIDRFAPQLVEQYLGHMLERLGVDVDTFMGLGRSNPFDPNEFFSMAVLAIRTSQFCNGVSRLHGEVARSMWSNVWPGVPDQEVPIGHVTNGVHPRSWIASNLMSLYDRYLSPDWQLDPRDYELWEKVSDIPDEELWRNRSKQREKLIAWCRQKIRRQLKARGASFEEIERGAGALDPDVMTIGFARRFATYKRGTLLLSDLERLRSLLNNADRPFQVLIAGKAHPADGPGKEIIREIVKLANSSDHLNRIVFLEDYDIEVGRWLVQGCDIWLNTPRRGMEASGTSGMKCAMNGVINCSILDGWWDEAFDPEVGFSIGNGEMYDDPEVADAIESRALLDALERWILPEFYERDEAGLPRKWIKRMKNCIAKLTPRFSTMRMVGDYVDDYYVDAHTLSQSINADGLREAGELATNIDMLRREWSNIAITSVSGDEPAMVKVRTPVQVRAEVRLGGLSPEHVRVQLYHGRMTSLGDMEEATPTDMQPVHDARSSDGQSIVFDGSFKANASGRLGYTVRVVPRDERIVGTLVPGLITWHHEASPASSVAKRSDAAVVGAGH
jgi:starch phosphorylase